MQVESYTIQPSGVNHKRVVGKGLDAYNLSYVKSKNEPFPVGFHIAVAPDQVIAGIYGFIGYWGGLEISSLWVDETFRRKGVGAVLLSHLESYAREKGAVIAMVDTFNFQALDFYLATGYQEFGRIDDFPEPGKSRHYLKKILSK